LLSAGDSNAGQIPQRRFTLLHALRELDTEDQQHFSSARPGPGAASATCGPSEARATHVRLLPAFCLTKKAGSC